MSNPDPYADLQVAQAVAHEAYMVDRFVTAYQRFLKDIRKEKFARLPDRQRRRLSALGYAP